MMSSPLRIGQIPYLNSVLFYHGLEGRGDMVMEPLVPRQLSGAAVEDGVDAGPVPLVTCWEIERRYQPLDDFAIATVHKTRSIFLFSRRPFDELDGAVVGVTGETSTSVRLLKVLLEHVYRARPTAYVHVDWPSNDAFLLIGDEALLHRGGVKDYPHMMDLGEVWHDWTGLPFVFARWMIRRDVAAEPRAALVAALTASIESSWANFADVVETKAKALSMSLEEVREYMEGFRFRLTAPEIEAMDRFKQLDGAVRATDAISTGERR